MAEEFDDPKEEWLSAAQSLAVLTPAFGAAHKAVETIIDRCGAGLIISRCRRYTIELTDNPDANKEFDNRNIDLEFWKTFRDQHYRLKMDWVLGDFAICDTHNPRSANKAEFIYLRIYGAEFRKIDIDDLSRRASASAPQVIAKSAIVHKVPTATDATAENIIRNVEMVQRWLDPTRQLVAPRHIQTPASPIPPQPSGHDLIARYGYALVGDTAEGTQDKIEKAFDADPAPTSRKPISEATLKAWWEMCKTLRAPNLWDLPAMQSYFAICFPDKSVSRDRLRDVRGKQKSGPKPRAAE